MSAISAELVQKLRSTSGDGKIASISAGANVFL